MDWHATFHCWSGYAENEETLNEFATVFRHPNNTNFAYHYHFHDAMRRGMERKEMIFMFGRFRCRFERSDRETTDKEKAFLAMKSTPGFVDGRKW